jgi:hypothetical protein
MSVNCTDFNNKDENGICLFVPKIHPRFNFRSVKGVFIRCGFGFIERVNVFRNGYFKSAVIIFRAGSWNNRNQISREVLTRLQNGESIRLTPDDDKAEDFPDEFWMVFVNSQDRNKSRKAPRPKIQFVHKPIEKVTRPMSPTYGPPDEDEIPLQIKSYYDEQDLDA